MKRKKGILKLWIILTAAWTMYTAVPAGAGQTAALKGYLQKTLKAEPVRRYGRWKKFKKGCRFILKNGQPAVGWLKIGKNTYHIGKDGYRDTGFVRIGGKYYLFGKDGRQKTGNFRIGTRTWYFDPEKNGAGTVKKADKDTAKTEEAADQKRNEKSVKTVRRRKMALKYDEKGNFYDRMGYRIEKATIKQLLLTALQPVGKTMYIWGGGWGYQDRWGNYGSTEASTIGISPRWKKFFRKQGSYYNYNNYRYASGLGLDCSGYVGWTLYNTFNTVSGHGDYVMLAQKMTGTFADWGWGRYTSPGNVYDHHAGDIMSLAGGHVYIVIGECSDGSVVLVHSSPKGVMITGTATRYGSKNSRAVKLASKYMKKYFPNWYRKYPDSSRGSSYLTDYSRMRWYLKRKKSVMSDPDGLTKMNALQVLRTLLGKV